MKILHVLTDVNIGGAGRHVLTYLNEYDRSYFDIEVAVPAGSRLVHGLSELGAVFYEVGGMEDRSFSVGGVVALTRLFRRVKPDIVHTHASLSGRIAARLSGVSVVSTRHYCINISPAKARFPLKQMSGIFNVLFTDAVIAVSDEVKKGLVDTGTRASLVDVVYNGTAPVGSLTARGKKEVRAEYGIAENAFVAVQAARLSAEKGHEFTLDAAKLLMKTDPDIVIVLAGDGHLDARLRERIADEGIRNVIMVGFIKEIHKVFGIADVQLNASLTEATCLSLLEGMSAGLPAVAANVGGNPYVITDGENGLLVPVASPVDLADAVRKIKQSPELAEALSEGAVKTFENRFRGDVMAREIEKIYLKIHPKFNIL